MSAQLLISAWSKQNDPTPPPPDAEARRRFLERCEAELEVALQPIYAMDSGQLIGVESLTRGWAKLGFDTPHLLFDHAHHVGALEDLELGQIRKALTKVAALSQASMPNIFVNVDTRLLLSAGDLFDRVASILSAAGRPPQLFTIELSERHDKTAEDALLTRIRALGDRGFRLALDDFGVGVSDMRALYSFDLDYLKIDRFFIDGVARNQRKQFLVGRMIEIAHLLGQKVICEGIERDEDFRACRDLGGDFAQGYLFCPPLTDVEKIPARHVSMLEARQRRTPSAAVNPIREAMLDVEPEHYRTPLLTVLKRFMDPEHPGVCPIVDDGHEPIGVIRERDLRRFIYSPFGKDLIVNRAAPIGLDRFLLRYPLANLETSPDRLMELLADASGDGIIMTNGPRYAGFLPASALVRLSAASRLALAADSNPLTRLPGNRTVERFLADALDQHESDRLFCYFDIDSFKPFNDKMGFRTGDRAILLLSDILKKQFHQQLCSVCHIGGDDFFVGSTRLGRAEFAARAQAATDQFRHEAESLYAPEDRARGGIVAEGRDGQQRVYPLLTCSAGAIAVPRGTRIASIDRIADAITRVKRMSKSGDRRVALLDYADSPETAGAGKDVRDQAMDAAVGDEALRAAG